MPTGHQVLRQDRVEGGKPYRFFFDGDMPYSDRQIQEFARRFRHNSDLIIGANPEYDEAEYARAMRTAMGLGLKWHSVRTGQGMPVEFPGDREVIEKVTRTMAGMEGLSARERVRRWMDGAWITKHREWLLEDSRAGVFSTEWDNIHRYNATKMFLEHQAWERTHEARTGERVTTRITLKNIYPASARELAAAFDRFRAGQPDGLDPSRFGPIPLSEEHMSRADKDEVARILQPYGMVPADTLDTNNYKVILSRQPEGFIGPISPDTIARPAEQHIAIHPVGVHRGQPEPEALL